MVVRSEEEEKWGMGNQCGEGRGWECQGTTEGEEEVGRA
jgi:hypothetical protein